MAALWIKICGLRSAAAIEVAAEAGADAVGFVFHAPSPRHLEPAAARALQAAVPPGIERVAVFLRPSQALVDAALEAIAPDWVQTDAGDLEHLRLPPGQRVLPVLRSGGSAGRAFAGALPVRERPQRRRRARRLASRGGAGAHGRSSCSPAGSIPGAWPRPCAPCVRSAWT